MTEQAGALGGKPKTPRRSVRYGLVDQGDRGSRGQSPVPGWRCAPCGRLCLPRPPEYLRQDDFNIECESRCSRERR
jgi:hypothetical protein